MTFTDDALVEVDGKTVDKRVSFAQTIIEATISVDCFPKSSFSRPFALAT